MLNDDEEPHDWEIKDEEPPEQLRKKWEQEEAQDPQRVVCPSCKKETLAKNLTCIFCGTGLYFKNEGDPCRPNCHNRGEMESLDGVMLSQPSCPVRCFVTWIKRLFKKG